MNKFELINKVLISHLAPQDKCLLIELISRSNEAWESWPSVERLCKVRGIKHEKNFKGADVYLPGLVTKTKRGRKNFYVLNTPAVEGLLDAGVTIKHTNTPAHEGVNTPAGADNTPAQAENTPAQEGANTTSNNTLDTTRDNSIAPASAVAQLDESNSLKEDQGSVEPVAVPDSPNGSSTQDTPAQEGVSGWFEDNPEMHVRIYLKKCDKQYLAIKVLSDLNAGLYPELTGDDWCRRAVAARSGTNAFAGAAW